MAITSSNIHDGALNNPLDDRYVPVYLNVIDLPEVTDENNDELAVVQTTGGVYQVQGGAWVLLGSLGGGGGGGGGGSGDMLASVYDSNSDGKVDAADVADAAVTADYATAAGSATTADSATTAAAVSGVTGSAVYYGTDVAGTAGVYSRVRLTTSASSDPTTSDDAGDGYVVPWFWRRSSNNRVWVLVDATPGAAVWLDITTAGNITGLTNPLVAALDAAGHEIEDAVFVGFKDFYYDLDADADNLITSNEATLVEGYNAYMFSQLGSALTIQFPATSGLASGEAPFGIIAINLAQGGAVTLGTDESWFWEKANTSDTDPTIPTVAGSSFRLRYSYDPITQSYAVSLTHMTAQASSSGSITVVNGSWTQDSLSANNRDTHTHTHSFTSSTQNGGVYLVVVGVSDGFYSDVTPPGFLTELIHTPSGGYLDAAIWLGYYKPSQSDLNSGQIEIEFGKPNEIMHIAAFEVQGPTSGVAAGDTAYNHNSSARSSVPAESLIVANDGALMVAVCARDLSPTSGTTTTVAFTTANNFTELGVFDSANNGDPSFMVAVRDDVPAGTHNTPVFDTSDGLSGRAQMEAAVLEPS